MMTHVLERFRDGGVLFDGGLGTMLIARGLRLGRPPEEWNRIRPEAVRDIHAAYLKAGAEVITSNTFGGTPSRLAGFALGESLAELNRTGLSLAREALSRRGAPQEPAVPSPASGTKLPQTNSRFLAFSIGPTGKMLPPVGKASEAEVQEEFASQLASASPDYDLVLIETMYDLKEAALALCAAKSSTNKPVAVTLTFNRNPRGFFTVMGNEAAKSMRSLAEQGADVVGANCTLTSAEMIALARLLRESVDLPILCQPNAGKPGIKGGVPVYEQTPEDFARDGVELFELGIEAVGGCCGTTPEFIRQLSAAVCSARSSEM